MKRTVMALVILPLQRTVKVPTPVTNKPAAGAAAASTNNAYSSSAVATGIQALQQRHPGLDGSGTLICVIDTGVNYRLDLFGPCTAVGQPAGSCRVVTGYDLVGDLYNGYSGGPPPVGGNDPVSDLFHKSYYFISRRNKVKIYGTC